MPAELGTFILPKPSATPASPRDGQMWYDTTEKKTRVMEAGRVVDVVQEIKVDLNEKSTFLQKFGKSSRMNKLRKQGALS